MNPKVKKLGRGQVHYQVAGTASLSMSNGANVESYIRHAFSFTWLFPQSFLKFTVFLTIDMPFSCEQPEQWWGDGTFRNDVSSFECSGTPGPQINRPLRHNVPGLIHPCHYALYNTFRLVQNDRDVTMQGYCVSRTMHLRDQRWYSQSHKDILKLMSRL